MPRTRNTLLPGACSEGRYPSHDDQAHSHDEGDEGDWHAILLVMGGAGFPRPFGPTLDALITSRKSDLHRAGWVPCRFIIRAERRQAWVEHRILVTGLAAIDVSLEHRDCRAARGRRWTHRLDGMSRGKIGTTSQ